jgi:tryptophan 2,3-dioxygenase
METLTPQDFLDFRDKLVPASGFQSFQMREIEIVLGLPDSQRAVEGALDPLDYIRRLAGDSPSGAMAWGRIEMARREESLRDALSDWLYRTPIQGSSPAQAGDEKAVQGFLKEYLRAAEALYDAQGSQMLAAPSSDAKLVRERVAESARRAREFLFAEDVPQAERRRACRIRAGLLFIESYRELPLLAWPRLLVDTIVELEEQLVLWRTRHARMVERTIGRRMGTGGSAGVDYLDQTARYRIFVELWAVRTLLLPRRSLPELRNPQAYGFAR